MKKILTLIAVLAMAASFFSCEKTQEEILKEMIESRLDSTMHNPKSYEFVSMSPIDSVMSKWDDEDDAKKIKIFISMYESETDVLNAKADNTSLSYNKRISLLEQGLKNLEKVDSLKKEYISRDLSYTPHLTGYYTLFKFRGQNKFGAIILNEYKVIFNKELTEIKDVEVIE